MTASGYQQLATSLLALTSEPACLRVAASAKQGLSAVRHQPSRYKGQRLVCVRYGQTRVT